MADTRYALKQLWAAPGFALLIIGTLALGIGANVTMASAVDRLLLRAPPHIRDADRVTRLVFVAPERAGGEGASAHTSYPVFEEFRRGAPALGAVAAFSEFRMSVGSGVGAVRARATLVSDRYFSVLGVHPALGRLIGPAASGWASHELTAVLDYGFWARQFAGDRGVVGRTLQISGRRYTVIGVAPRGFRGVQPEPTDVWLPLAAAVADAGLPNWETDAGATWLTMVTKLAREDDRVAAEQQATAVWQRLFRLTGRAGAPGRVVAASVIPGRGLDQPREVRVTLWLLAVSAVLLLIACANVANLLLARAVARRRDLAVRMALGARLARLARQLLTEALVIAGFSGAAALWVAAVGGRYVARFGGAGSSDDAPAVDWRLFIFTASIAVGTAVLISVAPLLWGRRAVLAGVLRAGPGAGGGRTAHLRLALLGVQSTLCMCLLIVAGLFAQSLRRVQGIDPGADVQQTLMVSVDLAGFALPSAARAEMYDLMLRRIRAVPGVARAALAEEDPFTYGRANAVWTTTRTSAEVWAGRTEYPYESAVDSGYFRTVGATLRGRDFDSGDRRGAPRVAVINEALARLLWPGQDPLGQCMVASAERRECIRVVGVTRGFWKFNLLERDKLVIYVPLAQNSVAGSDRRAILVAVRGPPASTIGGVRSAAQSVRPDLPAVSIATLGDVVSPELRPWRFTATVFSLFGAVALVVAAVGLYGVVAFAASQRAAEVAVRVTLGAGPRHVLGVIGGDGLRVVAAGLALGTAIAVAAGHWIGPLLFETSPVSPAVIASMAVVLLASAVLASIVPTLRVLRRNPSVVLRAQ